MLYGFIAFGGALGAIARYITSMFAQNMLGMHFPYGTVLVNVVGSFLAGFILTLFVGRYSGGEYWRLFFIVGFLGAYTTFSSFAIETLLMFEQGQWAKLLINILLNNLGSLTMVLIGSLLGKYIRLQYMH